MQSQAQLFRCSATLLDSRRVREVNVHTFEHQAAVFKSSRECLQRVQDQQQLPALVNSCFTEVFLPVPKRADAVPSRLKKCGGKDCSRGLPV